MHPVCLGISFLSVLICMAAIKGVKLKMFYLIPMMIAIALINPAFNHEGVTVLMFFKNGNPLTMESIIYGLAAAFLIFNVICWFSCYNAVMTSDKFIYLFGRIIPSMSLVLSMTLRFVPKFAEHLKELKNAQKCIGCDMSGGNIMTRAKKGLSILSSMTTWALENSVETADSMKSRGYGLSGRTAFSIFVFDKRDALALLWIVCLSLYVLVGSINGATQFSYFPSIRGAEFTGYGISVYAAYFALCIFPAAIELCEVKKWKSLKSKI